MLPVEVFYELLMVTGPNSDSDLETTLNTVLSSFLKKLDCFSGCIIQTKQRNDKITANVVQAIPQRLHSSPYFPVIESIVPNTMEVNQYKSFQKKLPLVNFHNETYYHSFDIKGFGIICLLKNESRILDSAISFIQAILDRWSQTLELHEQKEVLTLEKTRAVESNQTKTTFLANVSHDIKTPLNSIMGFSSLLKNSSLSEKQAKYVDNIIMGSNILLSLVSDVLDISKIEAKKIKLEVSPCDLHSLVRDMIEVLRINTDEKSLNLDLKAEGKIPKWLMCDPTRLRQILLNLINNAIKFTEEGTININISIKQTEPKGQDGQQHMFIHLTVQDSGIGIKTDEIEKIFKPYSQIKSKEGYHRKGTGLGLSIVKSLVDLMKGKIGVKSKVGVGTTFDILIPTSLPSQQEVEFHESFLNRTAPTKTLTKELR